MAKKVDEKLAAAHKEVRKLQFELQNAEKQVKNVQPLLKAIVGQKGAIAGKAIGMIKGTVPSNTKLSAELDSQLKIDQQFSALLTKIDNASKAVAAVAKL